MLLPLLLLSLCNAPFFGRCVCVLTEDGIYSHQSFIRWQDVNEMVFHLGLPSRNRWNYSYVEVKGHDFTALFPSAPCRMLKAAKQYKREIKIKIDRADLVLYVAMPAIIVLITAAAVYFS